MNNLFKKMMEKTGNMYATVAKDGVSGDIKGFADTGSYMLNALISGNVFGGFPKGKITVLAGESGTGKTFILLSAIKLFLDENPTGAVFFFESESAITQRMMINKGIDINRVIMIPVTTVEGMKNQCASILDLYNKDCMEKKIVHNKKMAEYIDSNKKAEKHNNSKAVKDGEKEPLKIHEITEWVNDAPIMVAVDSIGNLSTETEINNALNDKNSADMGRREKLLKSASRILTQMLAPFQIPMIMTSHVYMTLETYSKAIASGGSGPKYTASCTLFLFKNKIVVDKNHIGNNVRCVVDKGRFTKEGTQGWIQIMFSTGLNRYYGLIAPGVEAGIVEQAGAWYTFPNGNRYQGENQIYDDAENVFDMAYLNRIQSWVVANYCYGDEDDYIPDESDSEYNSKINESTPEPTPESTPEITKKKRGRPRKNESSDTLNNPEENIENI